MAAHVINAERAEHEQAVEAVRGLLPVEAPAQLIEPRGTAPGVLSVGKLLAGHPKQPVGVDEFILLPGSGSG
jgi:hypothetical protein